MTTPCPCGSQKELADCCLPYVEGRAFAPTAEALMRSRFTAYSLGRVDYILTTYDPRIVMQQDAAGIADWARRSQFWKLEILKTEAGGPDDLKGTVHFNATIFENGKVGGINERSNFERLHGKWYYKDGKHFPFKAPGPNDVCPCGSGKKYKKCHGA
jgi:SEC-C motif domain protein